jgi:hypothetical protein
VIFPSLLNARGYNPFEHPPCISPENWSALPIPLVMHFVQINQKPLHCMIKEKA